MRLVPFWSNEAGINCLRLTLLLTELHTLEGLFSTIYLNDVDTLGFFIHKPRVGKIMCMGIINHITSDFREHGNCHFIGYVIGSDPPWVKIYGHHVHFVQHSKRYNPVSTFKQLSFEKLHNALVFYPQT